MKVGKRVLATALPGKAHINT